MEKMCFSSNQDDTLEDIMFRAVDKIAGLKAAKLRSIEIVCLPDGKNHEPNDILVTGPLTVSIHSEKFDKGLVSNVSVEYVKDLDSNPLSLDDEQSIVEGIYQFGSKDSVTFGANKKNELLETPLRVSINKSYVFPMWSKSVTVDMPEELTQDESNLLCSWLDRLNVKYKIKDKVLSVKQSYHNKMPSPEQIMDVYSAIKEGGYSARVYCQRLYAGFNFSESEYDYFGEGTKRILNFNIRLSDNSYNSKWISGQLSSIETYLSDNFDFEMADHNWVINHHSFKEDEKKKELPKNKARVIDYKTQLE